MINYKPVIETRTKAYFRGRYGTTYYLFEYDKTNGQSRSMDLEKYPDGFINDLDGGENYFPYCTNRTGDIWMIEEDAYSFMKNHSDEFLLQSSAIHPESKQKLRTFIKGLKQDDNPGLIIVYLKKKFTL